MRLVLLHGGNGKWQSKASGSVELITSYGVIREGFAILLCSVVELHSCPYAIFNLLENRQLARDPSCC